MKRSFAFILAACMLTSASSCAANRTSVPEVSADEIGTAQIIGSSDGSATPDVTEPGEYSIKGSGGWWKHVGGSTLEYDPFVDAFYIDEEAGTWTEYSLYGIRGGTYACYADELGIHLEYGDAGDTILRFDGVSLLNAMGIIEYVPADPIEESESAFEGDWYLFGDGNGECLTFRGDEYILGQTSGNWSSKTVTVTFDGVTVTEKRLELADSPEVELIVAEAGDVLYDHTSKTAYIRKAKLGTEEGEDFVKKYDLICHKWEAEGEDMPTVEFGYYGNKLFLINELTLGGETQTLRDECGTWGIRGYELSIHYSDGHEEITPYDPERLMFSYYSNMVLNKTAE